MQKQFAVDPSVDRAVEHALQKRGVDRRSILVSAGAFLASGAVGGAFADLSRSKTAANPGMLNLAAPTPQPRYRPTFVKNLANLVDLNATNQGAAYWHFDSYITPVEDFFIRNEYPTPRADLDARVDPRQWRLKIHGNGVERELEIGYEDLLKLKSRSVTCTMECAGNGRSLFWEQQDMMTVGGTGWGLGGIGQAEWRIVPFSEIFALAGIKPSARHVLLWSGVDGKTPNSQSDTGRPIPLDVLASMGENAGLAFKMNGADLPPDHGAPVRALVPGWCGAASTKWLTEIKIASHAFWVPLNTKRHVLIGPAYKPPLAGPGDEFRFASAADLRGEPVAWCPPRSLLTVPLVLEKQPKFPHNYPLRQGELPMIAAGDRMMTGFAWAPRHGVRRIEYRIDGRAWRKAQPMSPLADRLSWVRFQFPWLAEPGEHVVETRVTDRSGARQPESVPFNEGGFDFNAVPKFRIRVA